MSTKEQDYIQEKITWKSGPEPLYPYRAECEGEQCLIRILASNRRGTLPDAGSMA